MRLTRLFPIAAVVFLSACEADTTNPTVNVDEIVNQMTGSGIAAYSSVALGASVPAASVATAVPTAGASSCAYQAATQRFDCTPFTANGITITRSYQLLNATGQPLSTPDPTAIVAIRTIADIEGTYTPPAGQTGTFTIDRHEDATMTGLRTATHLLNGTATQHISFASQGVSYTGDETSTTSNLHLPQASSAQKWPLGGMITTDRTAVISTPSLPAQTVVSHDVITFEGNGVMTVTTTANGLSFTCKINLATPGQQACS